jgi:hypothetical protein
VQLLWASAPSVWDRVKAQLAPLVWVGTYSETVAASRMPFSFGPVKLRRFVTFLLVQSLNGLIEVGQAWDRFW